MLGAVDYPDLTAFFRVSRREIPFLGAPDWMPIVR